MAVLALLHICAQPLLLLSSPYPPDTIYVVLSAWGQEDGDRVEQSELH